MSTLGVAVTRMQKQPGILACFAGGKGCLAQQ